ncbi:prephenate dehydratase [Oligella urethralis]|uniref:prephenate dehydratase n=1 Tax=Oligella urethralis TaxID=90245 RepID=UPI000E026DC9|nr:prephenate dehydratase [Oligella urethralis]SUA59612.1 P-protein [Oligella urethralis]
MSSKLNQLLKPLRDRIDAIDHQILDLLNQRAQTAIEVGKVKHAYNADDAILKPEREAQVIGALQGDNLYGTFPNTSVEAVWTEIISACRGLERGLTIAYLGPKGSFSEQAAYEFYGHAVQMLECPSFDEVFRAVEAGQADVGMVPVENSTEGAVNRTQDLLLSTTLKVHGERTLPIRHCLMTKTGEMKGVERIMAHPQTLAQCHQWLSVNYPNLPKEPAASNSEAARIAAEDPTVAAIAGKHAALAWDLSMVSENIQDDANNKTRFLAIGHIVNQASGNDQTSLIVAVPNRVGALHDLIAPFLNHGVSMCRFESRPARTGQWEYYFYIDILGHRDDDNIRAALSDLEAQSSFLKILGSYPRQSDPTTLI